MWIFNNLELPTEDKFVEDSRGLSLFVTDGDRANQNPEFYIVDSQSNYNRVTPLTFDSVTEETPIPTDSTIYEYRGFVSPSGFTESPTLFYLDNNRFFYDYIDFSTFVVVPGASNPAISATFDVAYNFYDFTALDQGNEIFYSIDLSEETFNFNDLESINVGGLTYFKSAISSTSPGEFYREPSTNVVTIHTDKFCGPSPEISLDFTFSLTEAQAENTYSALRFDFSSSNLDYIDFLSHQNINYYPSAEITSKTLIYNRIQRIALCLL